MRRMHEMGGSRMISGFKQVLRALKAGKAVCLYLAQDAAPHVVEPVKSAALAAGVPVETVSSMKELGHACGISVGASCAARLR